MFWTGLPVTKSVVAQPEPSAKRSKARRPRRKKWNGFMRFSNI